MWEYRTWKKGFVWPTVTARFRQCTKSNDLTCSRKRMRYPSDQKNVQEKEKVQDNRRRSLEKRK